MILGPIYKRSNLLNKINKWSIEIENNKFRSISGYHDGVQTTGDWTVCEEKNIGKKNSTTPEEQALAQAKSLYQKKKDSGYWEDINDCDKQKMFEPMLAKDFKKEKDKIKYPVFVQPKFDGMRCVASSNGLFTRNGKEILSAPHILESISEIFERFPDLILDGELYCDKDKADFNKIISLVRKTKPTLEDIEESKQYIKYYVYDYFDSENPEINFEKRSYNLSKNIKIVEYPNIVEVISQRVYNENELKNIFTDYIDFGYEGIMIRIPNSIYENKRSKGLLKYKEFITEEFIIKDIIEGQGKLTGKVGAVLCETKNKIEFTSAINGTHEYLEEVFKNKEKFINKLATIKFFEWTTTENPVPRFPKIIELDRFDI